MLSEGKAKANVVWQFRNHNKKCENYQQSVEYVNRKCVAEIVNERINCNRRSLE